MDRDKSLDLALANIEKQFGKGSLMRLGDAAAVKVAAIPSGALSLDLALGIGGLPRGRVVEIFGPESSGKCLTAGTYIWTDHGLETLTEVFARVGQATSCTSRVTDVTHHDVRLVNEEDDLEQLAAVTHNNRRPAWRVTLESGRHVEATANHPLRVLNERGRIVWRQVGQLQEGDVLVSALFGAETATGNSDLTEDEAVLLGYLVAEGTVGQSNRHSVTFTKAHDPDVQEEYLQLVEHVLGVERDRVHTYADRDDRFFDTEVRGRLAEQYGLDDVGSAGKDIPHVVRTGGPKIQRAFLSALFEGDGWVEAGPNICLTSASRTLAEQVQHLLYAFGIPATLRTRHHDELDRDDHQVSIPAAGVPRFLEQIGFRSARREDQVARLIPEPVNGELAARPFTYERVVAIESLGAVPTFDVMVPDTHSFLANGVLSHNTTVALHVIAEAQKTGGIAAFIDAEHALDPMYAKALGVDINELLVSQPDTGEQALEIADMLIRSNAVDIVVIDSVAALTPRAEIEGEMGDSHVGLQARLMSQALRKLSGSISRSKTCAVFINQLREKVGVMFGSPETTPGGRALKFYSSVRLDVRRIETLKDGAEAVGNRVRVKVVKNKCVAAGTQVFDPSTGLTHRIEDIVHGEEGDAVWAADKAGQMHVRPILQRMDQGEQETIGLELRDGTELVVTPDHRVLTEHGWREAGELQPGDRVARPRRVGSFGTQEPIPVDHARLVGYLIGDGYVGGKTPIAFINTQPDLHADAASIAEGLGCRVRTRRDGFEAAFSHRPGEKNGVLELARWAGIYGHLAWEKRIPAEMFGSEVSSEVLANLVFGIWESDGWISREQTGGLRVGFVTTSEQLAWQLHWLLLRWGITSAVTVQEPGSRRSLISGRRVESKRSCWQIRVSGIDNVTRFTEAIPMWGPRGRKLSEALDATDLPRHRGSRSAYLSEAVTTPVLEHLRNLGLRPLDVAAMVGDRAGDPRGGLKQVLGTRRLRRDHVARLAATLEDPFLEDVLRDDLYYDRIQAVHDRGRRPTFDIEVEELHTFVADDIVVHNCAPPFRQAEFDIVYGEGISKEGSLIDVGVDEAIIRKAGAWYTYEGEQLGQGKENARSFLKENLDVAAEIEKKIKDKLGVNPIAAEELDAEVVDEDEEA